MGCVISGFQCTSKWVPLELYVKQGTMIKSTKLFSELGILKLLEIYSWHVAVFMYKYSFGKLPLPLKHLFTKSREGHTHNTRNLNTILTPRHKNACVLKSLFHTGSQIWNNLTTQKRTFCSLLKFKKDTKKHFLQMYK